MKQFKTNEEEFRKFITKVTRITELLKGEYLVDTNGVATDCYIVLKNIDDYKQELGMYKHSDAVKSDKYIEQEIPFIHE